MFQISFVFGSPDDFALEIVVHQFPTFENGVANRFHADFQISFVVFFHHFARCRATHGIVGFHAPLDVSICTDHIHEEIVADSCRLGFCIDIIFNHADAQAILSEFGILWNAEVHRSVHDFRALVENAVFVPVGEGESLGARLGVGNGDAHGQCSVLLHIHFLFSI